MARTFVPYGLNEKIINPVILAFEKIDIRILVFIILCLNLLSFSLSTNEEAYLPLAKQYMDASWMPNSFLFNEWPGNRLVFQWIAGFFLRYVEFEPFVFIARMAVFALISLPVGAIFRKLGIKNILAIIVFQIYLLHQNYFAQEFIFGDFEAKSIAYIFVMAALYYLICNKFLISVLFSVAAAYFHILVGGWCFALILIYTLFATKSFRLVVQELLLFLLLLLPYAYYLGAEIVKSGAVINGVNIDWVYVYFRNAHHLAPLALKERLPETIFQISVTAALFVCAIFILRKVKGEFLNKFFILNVIVFSLLFLSLGISLYDKTGTLLKFYLFRIAALGCFLMYLYIALVIKAISNIPPLIKIAFFLVAFYLIMAAGINTFNQIFRAESKPDYEALLNFAQKNTKPEDVFLNLDDYEFSFSRKTRREEFVVYKFVPGGGKKIYEWYTRVLDRKNINTDISKLSILKQKYRLDYVISDHNLEQGTMLKLVLQNKTYSLYRIL
jgi:hypothetical protein